MTTRIRRTLGTLVAGAAVVGALAGCSAGSNAGVAPAASEHGAHGSGTHTMPDGRAMSDTDMAGMDMSGMDMSGMGHGGDGLALWATQKAGGAVMVTDGDGSPLYRSDADCAGPCTAEWQPVIVQAGQTPDLLGVPRTAVGVVRRADGGMQLTLGGAPLYRHAGAVPAQPDPRQYAARGWYVVGPTGQRVTG